MGFGGLEQCLANALATVARQDGDVMHIEQGLCLESGIAFKAIDQANGLAV